MNTCARFYVYLAKYVSETKIFGTKVAEESETHAFPVLLTDFEVITRK